MKNVLLIGLDGVNWRILDEAINAGVMPCLQGLRTDGAWGSLKSTIPTITPAAWGSFQTGVLPGLNNVFDFSYFDRSSCKKRYVTSNMLQKTIWQFVSEAGGNVSVVNVPMTYPPYQVNGYMVSGITTPSEKCNFTYPKKFKEEIYSNIPDYHIFTLKNTSKDFLHKDIKPFVAELKQIIDNRAKLAKLVINKQPHNIFMVQFQATDVLQHVLWIYLDRNSPVFSKTQFDYILREFYGYIDSKIAEIIEEFRKINGDDFLTLLLSDHGFESHICRFNLGNWLVENNYIALSKQRPPYIKTITRFFKLGNLSRALIGEEKTKLIEYKMGLIKKNIDWGNSSAISIGRSGEGYIYILEADFQKRQELISEIKNKLKKIEYKGQRLIEKIATPPQLYGTECSDIFPDLILIPVSGFSFTGDVQQGCGLFSPVTAEKDFHLGKHHIDGFFVANGNDIVSKKVSANIIDLMPTMMDYLEIPVPDYIQGKSIDIFNYNIIHKTSNQGLRLIDKSNVSDENSDIEKRLNDLGYM